MALQIGSVVRGNRTWRQAWDAAYEIAYLRGGWTLRQSWGFEVYVGPLPCKVPR